MVLLKSADWSYILKLKGIVLDVLKLGVVFKLHPAGVRLCHIFSKVFCHYLFIFNNNSYPKYFVVESVVVPILKINK